MIHGGKSYVSSPPAFSNDAKRLLICSGNTVSIFSTSTGLLVNELEGHKALVTSVVVVPNVLSYCWTSSLDGTLRYWDFSVPELMKTVNIHLPVYSMVIPHCLSKQDDKGGKSVDVFAYISVENKNGPGDNSKSLRGQIRKCNLTTSKLASAVVLKETAQPECITSCPSGEFFGIRIKRTLHIWKVPANDCEGAVLKKIRLHHTKNFSTFAFHPNGNIVAAGDVTGRILVWRSFAIHTPLKRNEQANAKQIKHEDETAGLRAIRGDDGVESCSTWHWHSSEVKFLAFSSDGAYLYSGGNEGVLMLWHLDTGKQKFLPRIGSPLLYFVHSSDSILSAISCAENQIHILKMPSLEILKSISGIKLPCSLPDMWNGMSGGFSFDHSAGLVALPTENYNIQFYSMFDDTEVSKVQICERNHQPSDDIMVVVSLVSLSRDGSLMCTVETRLAEDGVGGLTCLKFWTSVTQKKDFELSTVVYEPHREAAISAIAFRPGWKMVASSSYGGDFKIWVHNNTAHSKSGVHESSGWVCHSFGSYNGKSMTAATFSTDGSILAVAAETVITLWDPDRNYLVAVVGETYMPISNLTFAGKSEYIVAASQDSRPQLSLWCLSKLSRTWSYDLRVEAIACVENDLLFAVLVGIPESYVSIKSLGSSISSEDGIILVFDGNDPVPVAMWLVRKAKGGGLAFLQVEQVSSLKENTSSGRPLLAYINNKHEYVLFDPLSKEQHEHNVNRKKDAVDMEESGLSGYASIYGELPLFDPKKTVQATISPSDRPWETIFNGPSHTLPPLTKLCSSFLESLLQKRTTASD